MDIQKTERKLWFPGSLNVSGEKGLKAEKEALKPVEDGITLRKDSDDIIARKPVFGMSHADEATNGSYILSEKDPNNSIASKWIRNSIIGLFVGLTLLGTAGCNSGTTTAPPAGKATSEKVVDSVSGKEFVSMEEFRKTGMESLVKLSDIAKRYGGDFYGKTNDKLSEKPVTAEEAFKILVKGESFYFKGSSSSDPVEIKNISQLGKIYKEVLKEAAVGEAKNGLKEISESMKDNEYANKVVTHLSEIAEKFGGNIYRKTDAGVSSEPCSPVEAYKDLVSGKGFYFKGSKNSSPIEIKSMQQLGSVYKEILKEAAIGGVVDEGMKWVEESLKDSSKAAQLISHLTDITGKYGGNIYSKTKDGPGSEPIAPAEAYKKLSAGESIFLKITKDSKPVEIKDMKQMAGIYKEIAKELAASGISKGQEYIKESIKESAALKDLLVHLSEINAKYGGSLFEMKPDGKKADLSPLDAYQHIMKNESFYYQASNDAAPVQIKTADDLAGVYFKALEKVPQNEANKDLNKTGDLFKKLVEEQIKKYLPGGNDTSKK